MLRVFLSRRWLGWHLLLLAGLAVLILLGRWQWDRAQSQVGTLQNLGYAFEWWLFALLAVYGWWREMRADARAARRSGEASAERPPAHVAELVPGLGSPPRSVVAAGVQEDVDAEVAAYNDYLARLNARHVRQRH